MKKSVFPFGAGLTIYFFAFSIFGQALTSPYAARLQPFLTGLDRPILIRNAGDGSKRLFIVQQTGIIRVLQPGSITPTTFINLTSKIVVPTSAGDERGLLGMTFHPQFATNGKFYVNYTRVGDGATVVEEYKTVAGNPNQGDITTERILFTVPQPFANHNGGMVEFGPDGFLYIGMGDGGSADDPGNRAQNPAQLLGKMLRIDVNIPNGSSVPYLIPPSNPFTGANTTRCDNGSTTAGNTCQELWTIGMRNPWRWSFDRGGTHQLWVADVGQNTVEEIDVISNGGGNYGWRVYEGNICNTNIPGNCPATLVQIPPVFTYTHTAGRCSITGGYVYRGTQGSLPLGAYVFADYCTGEIWMLQGTTQTLLQDTPRQIVSFGEDEDGEIYVCYSNGQIDKITRAKAPADFEGDARSDISVFRPSIGTWFSLNSSNGAPQISNWGTLGDIPVPGDYDGDNISDIGIFRPSTGQWFILRSSDGTVSVVSWGTGGDVPAAADYDGDGKADLAVFRPTIGRWFIVRSSDSTITDIAWGTNGDQAVPGDYDDDGKSDIAVWRPSDGNWYSINSTNGSVKVVNWGTSGDITAQADFDGDGRTDPAVFRPSIGMWFILRSSNNSPSFIRWGTMGDVPVAADYDGDGKSDTAVFRPAEGSWYIIRSSDSTFQFANWGVDQDLPVPAYDNR